MVNISSDNNHRLEFQIIGLTRHKQENIAAYLKWTRKNKKEFVWISDGKTNEVTAPFNPQLYTTDEGSKKR